MLKLNENEQIELQEFKKQLSRLKHNEKIVYYTGKTPNFYVEPIVKAKMNAVYNAYERGILVPLQKRIKRDFESMSGNSLGIGEFEYFALGA